MIFKASTIFRTGHSRPKPCLNIRITSEKVEQLSHVLMRLEPGRSHRKHAGPGAPDVPVVMRVFMVLL